MKNLVKITRFQGIIVYEVDGVESTADEYTVFNLNVNALAGFFLVDSLEIGPVVSLSYSREKFTESEYAESWLTISLGGQIGYFFNTYSNLVPYIGAIAEYYSYTNTEMPAAAAETEYKYSGYSIEPRAGLNLFLSNSIAFAPYVFFQYLTATLKDSDPEFVMKRTDFGLRLDFNVFL